MSNEKLSFGYKENSEEELDGISPFIEAPCFTLAYPDPDSFVAVESSKKGTPGIEFVMVEHAITEGVDTSQYGGRRKSKQTIYFTAGSWSTIFVPFISKLGDHYFGLDTANKILSFCEKAYSANQDILDIRNALIENEVFKGVFSKKTPAYFLFSGQASYKQKDNSNDFWRSVYPTLNMIGTTVRPNTEQGKKEMQEYFDSKKDSLLNDKGEPVSNSTPSLSFNADMSNTGGVAQNDTKGNDDDSWESF